MTKVVFNDWEPGFQKVAFNHMLRSRCGLTLSQAIDAVGIVLKRERLEFSVDEPAEAVDLLQEATKLGVIGRIVTSPSEPQVSLVS